MYPVHVHCALCMCVCWCSLIARKKVEHKFFLRYDLTWIVFLCLVSSVPFPFLRFDFDAPFLSTHISHQTPPSVCECVYVHLSRAISFRLKFSFYMDVSCSALKYVQLMMRIAPNEGVQMAMILWIRNWCSGFFSIHFEKKRWNLHSIIKQRVRATWAWCACVGNADILIDTLFIRICVCVCVCFSIGHQCIFGSFVISISAPINKYEMLLCICLGP